MVADKDEVVADEDEVVAMVAVDQSIIEEMPLQLQVTSRMSSSKTNLRK